MADSTDDISDFLRRLADQGQQTTQPMNFNGSEVPPISMGENYDPKTGLRDNILYSNRLPNAPMGFAPSEVPPISMGENYDPKTGLRDDVAYGTGPGPELRNSEHAGKLELTSLPPLHLEGPSSDDQTLSQAQLMLLYKLAGMGK